MKHNHSCIKSWHTRKEPFISQLQKNGSKNLVLNSVPVLSGAWRQSWNSADFSPTTEFWISHFHAKSQPCVTKSPNTISTTCSLRWLTVQTPISRWYLVEGCLPWQNKIWPKQSNMHRQLNTFMPVLLLTHTSSVPHPPQIIVSCLKQFCNCCLRVTQVMIAVHLIKRAIFWR